MRGANGFVAATLGIVVLVLGAVGEVSNISPTVQASAATPSPAPEQYGPQISFSASVEIVPTPEKKQKVSVSKPIAQALPPLALEIPSQSVKARVTMRAIIASNGLLTAPDDPKELGWWSTKSGAFVIDGHVGIGHVPGALVDISRLGAGDKLSVENKNHQMVNYRVVETTKIPKGGLPAKYFSQKYNGWLLLITCGGSFDASIGHYRSNIVTLAQPG